MQLGRDVGLEALPAARLQHEWINPNVARALAPEIVAREFVATATLSPTAPQQ